MKKFSIHYIAVNRASAEVEAESYEEAVRLFNEHGRLKHVFIAQSLGGTTVEVERTDDTTTGISIYPDGTISVKY